MLEMMLSRTRGKPMITQCRARGKSMIAQSRTRECQRRLVVI